MRLIKQKQFIKALNREARLYIGLPDNYEHTDKTYPVIYMQDGHNVFLEEDAFKGVTWGMLDLHKKHPDLPDFIVVALDCAHNEKRLDEYGAFRFQFEGMSRTCGGEGDKYLSYLAYDLKPFIDKHYRTKKGQGYTAIMGSSMGGIISLYAGLKYHDVFGIIASLSGSFFVSLSPYLDLINKTDLSPLKKVYLDTGDSEIAGGNELDYVESNLEIYNALKRKLSADKLSFQLIDGGKHFEADWAARLPNVIRTIFS